MFDFFGYGQPGNGPAQNQVNDPQDAPDVNGWGLWPEAPNQQVADQNAVQQPMPGNQLDLNVAAADDELDGQAEIIQAANAMEGMEQQEVNDLPEDVIDASDQSDGSVEVHGQPHIPDLNDPVDVEIFIPQQDGQPLQINPDEILENDIPVNDPMQELQQEAPAPEQPDQYMQIGFATMPQPALDPVFATFHKPSVTPNTLPADLFRHWSKHLAPGIGAPQVNVPTEWATFFSAALLNPGSFSWAKNFLTSPAWQMINAQDKSDFHFALPDKCPVQTSVSCLSGDGNLGFSAAENLVDEVSEPRSPNTPNNEAVVKLVAKVDTQLSPNELNKIACPTPPSDTPGLSLEQTPNVSLHDALSLDQCDLPSKVSPSIGPWSKALLAEAGKLKLSEDDPELRRSCRKKEQNKGFRHKTCQDKKCIACEAGPPTLSPSVIKNLGAEFCKVDASKLTTTALLKKKKATAPVGKKPIPKKKQKDSDDDDKDKATKKKARK
ncbi:unnamed protein product [Urochloa humidicola]